jgi:hypothetical protein
MPFIGSFVRACAVLMLAALFAGSLGVSSAEARWLRAESERFVVYSEGGADQLTTFTRKLETFDRLLRWRMGLSETEPPLRKLTIYLVDGAAGINAVAPGAGSAGVGGFYRSDRDDIFAVAIRGGMGDDILLHEYAHHFMMQYFPYGYPAWFIEGFAEYFATAEIRPDSIIVGKYNRNRAEWLRLSPWLPTRELLTKRASQVSRRQETYYPVAWLLTHWFMGNEERHAQLNAYLLDVGAGGNGSDAMTRATGLSHRQLRAELRRYMGRLPYFEIRNRFPQAEVTITQMPAWADDLLLLSVRFTREVADNRKAAEIAEARRAAARYPDEPFARVMLGNAELKFGDAAVGQAILRDVIARDPSNLEAHVRLASYLLGQAEKDEAGRMALKAQAQTLLAQAYRLDDADYRIFLLLSEVRQGVAGYPNENDIATLELALTLAPQVDDARLWLAEAYLAAGRNEDAITTARALANDPHGGEGATRAQAVINRARGLTDEQARAEEAAADAAGTGGDEDGED